MGEKRRGVFFGKDDSEEDSVGKDGGDAVDEHDQPDAGVSVVDLHIVLPWGTVHRRHCR